MSFRMSLIMAQGDGMTIITVTTPPKSKWPYLCRLLGTLCYSLVCSVAHKRKRRLTKTLTTLGIVQVIVGVICIVVGAILENVHDLIQTKTPFWLGSLCLATGIMCVLTAKFPSPCLLFITVILNIVSPALLLTAVMLCSVDLAMGKIQNCNDYYYSYYDSAFSPCKWVRNWENCQSSWNLYPILSQDIFGGLDIMVIVLAVLQLCVTISFCILTLKFLFEKNGTAESVEDAQLYTPLLPLPILHARETH